MQELDFIGEVARNKRRLMLNFDYDEKLRIDLKTSPILNFVQTTFCLLHSIIPT